MRRLLAWLLPDLPAYEAGGGPVVPQAVILRDGPQGPEVLLVKRTTPRAWELPGGNVAGSEAPEEALLREVREETGLDVRIERLVGWYRRTGFRPHRSPVYVCAPTGGRLRASVEAVDIAFFPVRRLPLGLFPWYRPIVRDAARGITYPDGCEQRLGAGTVALSAAIHVAETARLLR
jgi:ADP-ribose pyrophosphatase YjhB (NUDIX family)